jgi:hypothetical protein
MDLAHESRILVDVLQHFDRDGTVRMRHRAATIASCRPGGCPEYCSVWRASPRPCRPSRQMQSPLDVGLRGRSVMVTAPAMPIV